MPAEDRLALTLRWNGSAITAAHVRSGRAVQSCRVLEGRSPEQAIESLGLMFGVCRASQQAAARLACEIARAGTAQGESLAQTERAALCDFALESMWRMLLDAPALVGEPPRQHELAAARARLMPHMQACRWLPFAAELDAVLEKCVFGMPVAEWQSMPCREWLGTDAELARVVSRLADGPGAQAAVRRLPWIGEDELAYEIAPELDACDDFAAAPQWRGAPAETGSFARAAKHPKVAALRHHPVAARVMARLAELAELPGRIRDASEQCVRWARGVRCADGTALAAVETARGTLIHAVRLADGQVDWWRIVAPTEWNFHPAGAFVRGIVGEHADDERQARAAAERLAFALDPCVAAEVAVAHA